MKYNHLVGIRPFWNQHYRAVLALALLLVYAVAVPALQLLPVIYHPLPAYDVAVGRAVFELFHEPYSATYDFAGATTGFISYALFYLVPSHLVVPLLTYYVGKRFLARNDHRLAGA